MRILQQEFTFLQQEIVKILTTDNATYSHPMTSDELSHRLNVTASYIRQTMMKLQKMNVVGVRHGSGGGFFLL
jgi:DNA-binding IscR family transcriptional regulator